MKDDNTRKEGMKKIRNWFGVDTDDDIDSSSDSDSDPDLPSSWKEIERKAKNKAKKEIQTKNRQERVALNSRKASHLLGLSPFGEKDIDTFRVDGVDYESAKWLAAKNYLRHFLKFYESELNEMGIKETLVSAKGDDTLYIAFRNLDHIKEIHICMAECQNPLLNTRNFIPPGFYARYMAASNKCSEVRKQYPDTKTQIRFGSVDIEIMMKARGSTEPYRSVKLLSFMGTNPLPEFDHTRQWKTRVDRPPRWKIVYDTLPNVTIQPTGRLGKHPLSRQNSKEAYKKLKDSSRSDVDMNTDDDKSSSKSTDI